MLILSIVIGGLSIAVLIMHITGWVPKFLGPGLRKIINEHGNAIATIGVIIAFGIVLLLGQGKMIASQKVALNNQHQMLTNQQEMIKLLRGIRDLLAR